MGLLKFAKHVKTRDLAGEITKIEDYPGISFTLVH